MCVSQWDPKECAGKTWTVNVMPESEYYSGTFRLWIDRPDKASFSIGFSPLETMAEGWNEVHYAPSTESSLRVSSTYIQDEIVAIEQDGVPVEVQPYSTELTLSEGTEIKVTTIYPEGDAKVKISFVNPDTESFISAMYVNDEEVSSSVYLAEDYELPIGTKMKFVYHYSLYKSEGTCAVNGVSGVPPVEYRLLADAELVYDVEKYRTLTKKINVSGGADHIQVTYRGETVALVDGENELTYQENYTTLGIEVAEGWKLASVTQGDADMLPEIALWNAFSLTEQGDVEIVVEEDLPDVEDVVYIDEDINLTDHMFTMAGASGFPMPVNKGYNHITGFSRDLPLSFFWYTMEGESSLYLNDEAQALTPSGGVYDVEVPIVNGDVVRIYVKETPAPCRLSIIDNTSAQVTAVRDYVKPVDFSSSLSVLPCTRIDFESVDGKEFFIKVCDLDTEKVTSKTVFINGDTDIVLTSVDNSVDGILTDSDGESAVYSLQGIKVGISSDMSGLPAGVYIVNGRKFTVR